MPSYDESRPEEFTSVLMIWLEGGTRPILWSALLQPGDSSPGRSDDSSYLPIGALRTALSYPAPEGTFSDERIRETLRLLGFDSLVDRLDETAHWEQSLSGGEQQRLAVARLLLHEPAWIFLDGATSSLDEETEKQIYAVLREHLPRSTIGDAGARIACGVVTKEVYAEPPAAAGVCRTAANCMVPLAQRCSPARRPEFHEEGNVADSPEC